MIKTRIWIICFSCVFIVSAVLVAWQSMGKANGNIANVYQDGQCIYSVDLSLVKESYELVVADGAGGNTLRIEPGRICIIEADCPDQICVGMGWLAHSASPIVCLPHRLVIRLEENAAGDDMARNNAAGNNAVGNDMAGNSVEGSNTVGNNATRNNAVENDVAGNSAEGSNTEGSNAVENDMAGNNNNVVENSASGDAEGIDAVAR